MTTGLYFNVELKRFSNERKRKASGKIKRKKTEKMTGTVERVFATIEQRKKAPPSASYVAGLMARAPDGILKKIAEEAGEVTIASKNGETGAIVRELCDLLFHSLVLMSHHRIRPERILEELERRADTSGLEEKNSRRSTEEIR